MLKKVKDLFDASFRPVIPLGVKKLNSAVTLPSFKTEGAACFDICSDIDIKRGDYFPSSVTKDGVLPVPTGLAFEIPKGYVMEVYIRSSLAKRGITLANGVGIIDSDYRGELKILLDLRPFKILKWIYEEDEDLHVPHLEFMDVDISKGDRIAQARIVPLVDTNIEVKDVLSETIRDIGGFGSTGK